MIHTIERQRNPKDAAALLAKAIRRKAHNGHYRNRLHVVAVNEDGSISMALERTSGADHIMRNPSRIIGTYFVTRDEAELRQRILEDLAEVAK